jgi:hypothetical protein
VNRDELLDILRIEGIRDDSYSLDGGLRDDRLTIDRIGDMWIVYYSERGKRWDERSFTDEDSACQYLLQLLRSDRRERAPGIGENLGGGIDVVTPPGGVDID